VIIVSYSGGGDVRNEKKTDQDGKKCLTSNLLEDITEESKVKSGQLQLPGTWRCFFCESRQKRCGKS